VCLTHVGMRVGTQLLSPPGTQLHKSNSLHRAHVQCLIGFNTHCKSTRLKVVSYPPRSLITISNTRPRAHTTQPHTHTHTLPSFIPIKLRDGACTPLIRRNKQPCLPTKLS